MDELGPQLFNAGLIFEIRSVFLEIESVKVDSEKVIKAPINQCDESVCEVKSLIPRGLSEQMKGGQTMMFAFFIEDEQIIYPVSLKGYRELYTFITE